MNQILAVALLCLATYVASDTTCPRDDDFTMYCNCHLDVFSFFEPELIVRCSGLGDNFGSVLSYLKGKDVKSLRLEQSMISTLLKEHVEGLHIHMLVIDNAKIKSIEEGALASIKYLTEAYFIKTKITEIPDLTNATNLVELGIMKHAITEIGPEDFPEDSKLETLEIIDGVLETINEGAFMSLNKLEDLNLEDNFISSLPSTLTSEDSSIQKIDLSHNHIEELPPNLFENDKYLDELYLRDNQIRNLTSDPFKALLERQVTVNVKGNPLRCDQSLCWLADYLEHSEQELYLVGQCRFPTFYRNLAYLNSEELNC